MEAVWQVDKLVANPQPHLKTHSNHQLVFIVHAGVGKNCVLATRQCADTHAGSEGLQVHGMLQVGQDVVPSSPIWEI